MVNKINNNIADMLGRLPDNAISSGVLKVSTDHKVTVVSQGFMESAANTFNWVLHTCKRVEHIQMEHDLEDSTQQIQTLTREIGEQIDQDRKEILRNGIDGNSLSQIRGLSASVSTKLNALRTALSTYRSFSSWGRVDKKFVTAYGGAVERFRALETQVNSLYEFAKNVELSQQRKDHFILSFVQATFSNDHTMNGNIKRDDPAQMRDYVLLNLDKLKVIKGSRDLKLRFDKTEAGPTQKINDFESGYAKRTLLNLAGWGAGTLGDTSNALRDINYDYRQLISSLKNMPREEVKAFAYRKLADFITVSTLFSDILNTYFHTDPNPDQQRAFEIDYLKNQVKEAMQLQHDLEDLADYHLPEPVYTDVVHEKMLGVESAPPQRVEAPTPAPAPAPQPVVAPAPAPAPQPAPAPRPVVAPTPAPRPVAAPTPAPAPQPVSAPALHVLEAPAGGTLTFDSSSGVYVFKTRYGGHYTNNTPFTRVEMDRLIDLDRKNDWTLRNRKYQ